MADEAKREAGRMLRALAPYAERGVPIVGLEPSCLLSLRDEFTALLPGTETVAKNAWLFEEFLAQRAGKLELPEMKRKVLLHGHCHQKAFAAMPAVEKVLGDGARPEACRRCETSCCGMAGSFGYEAEHYEVSMRMGELALLPEVRKAPAMR